MRNIFNKFTLTSAALLYLFLGAQITSATTTTTLNDYPAIARSEFFLRKPAAVLFRLNANAKKLAFLDTSTNKLMLANAACPECTDQHTAVNLPEDGKPFLYFWTKVPSKLVIQYFSPTKKRMESTVYDFAAKTFTALFPEENVQPKFVDASAKYFYTVPTAVYKVTQPNKEERYYKIDFEQGTRNEVSFKNNILEIEKIAGGTIGVDTRANPGIVQWVFTKRDGKQLPLARIDELDLRMASGFLTSYIDKKNTPHALFLNSNTTDTLALIDFNLATGKPVVIAKDKADIERVLLKPHGPAQAYIRNYLTPEWVALDPALAGDMQFFNQQARPVVTVESRSTDDSLWLIHQRDSTGREFASIYSRPGKTLKPIILADRSALPYDMGYKVRAEVITARDNTPLVSYLTTPPGKTCAHNDCPLVVLIHGGPHARDAYLATPTNAWLANRGYAVLNINFRGSSGFGKAFERLAVGQWGLAMQTDIQDGITWAIEQAKVADPKRIAIMGASHGGMLTLNAITSTPDRFACAIASAATVDLSSFVEKVVAYEPNLASNLYESVGDVRIPEVKAALHARSALKNIDAVNLKTPILITHGARDKLSPFGDMEAYAQALRDKGAKVAFVVYPEEAHGFNNPQTKATHYGIVENFLVGCLSGSTAEPVDLSTARQKVDIRFGEQEFTFLKNSRVGN